MKCDSWSYNWRHLTMAEFGGLLILQGMWTLLPWWATTRLLLGEMNVTEWTWWRKISLRQTRIYYEHSLLPEPGRPSQDPRASLQGPLRPLKTEKYEKTLVKMYYESVCYILQTI